MDYLAEIQRVFQCTAYIIEERIKQVAMKMTVYPRNLPTYENLLSLVNSFPERDYVKFVLKDDGSSEYTIDSKGKQNQVEYDGFKLGLFEEDPVYMTVEINKRVVDDQVSIYSFKRFCDDILSLAMTDVLAAFVDFYREAEHLYFKVYSDDVFCKTGTMAFSSAEHTITWGLSDRKDRLNRCRETACFYHQPNYPLLPDDFNIEVDFQGNPLSFLFSQISTALSLVYLSTNSSIQNGELRTQITGQRNLDYTTRLAEIKPNYELYRIYHWIFTEGNSVDKALLARNSISSHCKLAGIGNLDERTFVSIQANYNLYLKDNVAKYIELTNAMAGFILDSTNNVTNCITQLLGNLKGNILAVMSFVFTVVLANIVSGQPLENIFTFQIKIIMYIVFIGSLVYYLISVAEVSYKKRKMMDQYHDLLKHYEKVLPHEEINQITEKGKALSCAESSLKQGMFFWSVVWIATIMIAFLIVDYIGDYPHLVANFLPWAYVCQSKVNALCTTVTYVELFDGLITVVSFALFVDCVRGLWRQREYIKQKKSKVMIQEKTDSELLNLTVKVMDATRKYPKLFTCVLAVLFFARLWMRNCGYITILADALSYGSLVIAFAMSRINNRLAKMIRENRSNGQGQDDTI